MHVGVALAGLFAVAQVRPPVVIFAERDLIETANAAYFLGTAVHLAGPGDFETAWSADGRFLAAISQSIDPRDRLKATLDEDVKRSHQLTVWDSRIGTSSKPAFGRGLLYVRAVGWLGTTNSLAVVTGRQLPSGPSRNEPVEAREVWLWRPGAMTRIYAGLDDVYPAVSPTQPFAVLHNFEGEPRFQVLREDGTLRQVKAARGKVAFTVASDGRFALATSRGRLPSGQYATEWQVIQSDGSLVQSDEVMLEGSLRPKPGDDPNGLQTMFTSTVAAHGPVKVGVKSAWLWIPEKGQVRAALVAGEATAITLSPDQRSVAFVSNEHLMARPIQKLSPQQVDDLRAASEKNDLTSRAKQVGIAMNIYAADFDDRVPLAGDWGPVLDPYLRDQRYRDGFVYELNGDNLSNVDRATKRFGYIDGRYGRATVYADGRVIWEDRRKR